MAQNAPSKPRKALPTRKSSSITKKGQRTIAPKKKSLVKANKITKKYTAGLTSKTERLLGEKVGHLELLKGGRKGADGGGVKKEKKAEKGEKSK